MIKDSDGKIEKIKTKEERHELNIQFLILILFPPFPS